jgi:hypothetical protein
VSSQVVLINCQLSVSRSLLSFLFCLGGHVSLFVILYNHLLWYIGVFRYLFDFLSVFLLFSYIIINGFLMNYARMVSGLETIKNREELARGERGNSRYEIWNIARVKGLCS